MLVLLVVAVIVIGPERLPAYAEQLAGLVKRLRGFVASTKDRVDAEMGGELGDVDWTKLDPRRYDPRRIVRDALLDDESQAALDGTFGSLGEALGGRPRNASGVTGAGVAAGVPVGARRETGPAPFDDEAT
ncbi:sec-independent protein translocase protein TatB [Luteimicrobium subarcticum]|uniref:Sec-independent protein translocase protein TatB n=2 Tax=Luteimicrobium subarcticum TaxID=620910 RepID=A0A2M8WUI1_9MICO|nr:sec-independent protein translocase protein TatB [Luteimicrobium subarcticum]